MPRTNEKLLAALERANALDRRIIELIQAVQSARREERMKIAAEILSDKEGVASDERKDGGLSQQ